MGKGVAIFMYGLSGEGKVGMGAKVKEVATSFDRFPRTTMGGVELFLN